MKKLLTTLALMLVALSSAWAQVGETFEVGGNVSYLQFEPTTENTTKYALRYEVTKYEVGDMQVKIIRSANPGGQCIITLPTTATDPDTGTEYKVTGIGSMAFQSTYVYGITIPEGYTTIEDRAFYQCSLLSATLPNSATNIGVGVFYNCQKLESVTLPAGITTIPNSMFLNAAFTSFTIPASVTSIGNGAFKGCSKLNSFALEGGSNDYFSVIDGALFSKDKKTMIYYANGKTATSYTVPSEVDSIGYGAFSGNETLSTVTLPEGLLSIGSYAFSNCDALSSITIPSTVTEIDAFAFSSSSLLASITINATTPPRLDGTAFDYIKTGYTISVPDGSADAYLVHKDWKAHNIVVAEGQLGYTFKYGDFWYRITNSSTDEVALIESQDGIDYNSTTLTTPITAQTPDGTAYKVTSMGQKALYNNDVIETLVVSEGITSIDISAFFGCPNLASVSLPASLVRMNNAVFSSCAKLTSISLAASTPPTITYLTMNDININHTVTVPAGSEAAYLEHTDWKQFNIVVPQGAVGYRFTVNNIVYRVIDADDNKVEIAPSNNESGYTQTSISISATVTDPATSGETYSVTAIGKSAFSGAAATTISLPEGITTIADAAFFSSALTTISLPEGLQTIGNSVFGNCNSLTTVTLPSTLNSIGYWVFNCPSLSTINVNATTPPVAHSDAFHHVDKEIPFANTHKVFVPETSVAAYKAANCWKELNIYSNASYNVTVENGTSDVSVAMEGDEVTVSVVVDATKQAFSGWTASPALTFDDASSTTTTFTMPASDVTITANVQGKAFTLTFDAGDGSCATANQQVRYGTAIDSLPTATRTGYTLDAWQIDGADITTSTQYNFTENKTAEATWTIINYTITYNLGGGVNDTDNPTKYTVDSETITLAPASKKDHTFVAWYSDAAFENKVKEIPASSTDNIELFAKWKENTLSAGDTITYQDGTGYNLKYTINPDGATVSCIGMVNESDAGAADLVIPSTATSDGATYSVTSIGEGAFVYCTEFTGSLIISDGVTSIGEAAFAFCTKLSGNLTIPNSVVSIGVDAFTECISFTDSLIIGNSVNTIGDRAFDNCTKLASVISLATNVPVLGDYVFIDMSDTISFTVPEGSAAAYKAAANWSDFDFNRCTLTYNANDGTSATATQEFVNGVKQAFIANTFTRDNYTFLGWDTDASATTASYTDEQTALTFERDITLYAVWEQDTPDFAANFKTEHATALALTTETVAMTDSSIVNAALADYAELASEVQTALSAEKTLLDNLSAKIVELEAAAGISAATVVPFTRVQNTLYFAQPTAVAVYSVSGVMLYNGNAVTEYNLPSRKGIYIICTEVGTYKIVVE